MNNEIITIHCPHCGKEFHIKPRQLGREVRCSVCHNHVLLQRPTVPPPIITEFEPEIGQKIDLPTLPVHDFTREDGESDEANSREQLGKLIRAGKRETAEVDMTPMVDIVFLLLIFFMVTASFALQKSIETPPPESDEASNQEMTIEQLEDDADNIIVRIERDNTVWIEDEEAPTRQVLIRLLRKHREPDATGKRPSTLLVFTDSQAYYETIIMALDAGNAAGIENVRLATLDEE